MSKLVPVVAILTRMAMKFDAVAESLLLIARYNFAASSGC